MSSHFWTRRSVLMLGLGSVSACLPLARSLPSTQTFKPSPTFKVYDALFYQQRKPEIGLPKVYFNGSSFWKDPKDMSYPDEAACRALARYASKYHKFVIDIEHWEKDIRKGSTVEVKETVRKLLQILTWMKSEQPKLEIGIFSFPPVTDYWTPVTGNIGAIKEWERANDFLKPLAERVDFLAPELYTFYNDRTGWKVFANQVLQQARRYNKPIIPVMWPRFHPGGEESLKFTMVSGEAWAEQLQLVYQSGVDGVMLWDWGEFTTPQHILDPSWAWWKETVRFVQSLPRS